MVGLFASVVFAVPVNAADDAASVISYRQKVMSAVGAHMGSIGAVLKAEVSFSGHVAGHARALQAASLMAADIFPPGSGIGETRAKAEIWQKWADFEKAVKAFQDATGKLVEAADSGDMAAVGAAMGNLGQACGGCHKPFRKPKG
jgi:cytochrome c556